MDIEKNEAIYLARSVFSEWLNIKLSSSLWHKRGRVVYEEILQHARTGSLRLFTEQVPSRLIRMFKLTRDSETAAGLKKIIENELQDLLQKSADLIREHIESGWKQHAKFDKPSSRSSRPYITNLRIEKEEWPWAEEKVWEPSDSPTAEAQEEASDED